MDCRKYDLPEEIPKIDKMVIHRLFKKHNIVMKIPRPVETVGLFSYYILSLFAYNFVICNLIYRQES